MANFIRYPTLPNDYPDDVLRNTFDDLIGVLQTRDNNTIFGPAATGYTVSGTIPVTVARHFAVSAGSSPAEQTLGRLIQDLLTKGYLG